MFDTSSVVLSFVPSRDSGICLKLCWTFTRSFAFYFLFDNSKIQLSSTSTVKRRLSRQIFRSNGLLGKCWAQTVGKQEKHFWSHTLLPVLPAPSYIGCLNVVSKGIQRLFFFYPTRSTSAFVLMNAFTMNNFVHFYVSAHEWTTDFALEFKLSSINKKLEGVTLNCVSCYMHYRP